jgi:hypothetical protein
MNILKSMTLNNSNMISLDGNLENCPEKLAKIVKTVVKEINSKISLADA